MKKIWLAAVLLLFCTELDAQMQKQIRVRRLDADTVEVHTGANNKVLFGGRLAKIYYDSTNNKLMFVDPQVGPVALEELTSGGAGDTTFKWSVDGSAQIGDSIRFSPTSTVIPTRTGYVLSMAVDTSYILSRYDLMNETWILAGVWRFRSGIELGTQASEMGTLRFWHEDSTYYTDVSIRPPDKNSTIYLPQAATATETLATRAYTRTLVAPTISVTDSLNQDRTVTGAWNVNAAWSVDTLTVEYLTTLGHSGGNTGILRLRNADNSNWVAVIAPVQASNETLYFPAITSMDTIGTQSYARAHGAEAGTFASLSDYVKIGTTPASTGILRLPNNGAIVWRNVGGTADAGQILYGTGNRMQLSDSIDSWYLDGVIEWSDTGLVVTATDLGEAMDGQQLMDSITTLANVVFDNTGYVQVYAPAMFGHSGDTRAYLRFHNADNSDWLALVGPIQTSNETLYIPIITDKDTLATMDYARTVAGSGALGGLTDVDTTGKADGMVLEWSTSSGKWVPAADNTGGGGSGGGILDTVKGGNGLTLVMNSDSVHTMSVNVKSGIIITNDTLNVDTTMLATLYDIENNTWTIVGSWAYNSTLTLGQNATTTGVLRFWHASSNKYTELQTIPQSNDRTFRFPPTGSVYDTLATRAYARDSVGISGKIGWSDTTSTIATQYDLTQVEIHQLKGVDTAGISLGAILKWNGSSWVDSSDGGGSLYGGGKSPYLAQWADAEQLDTSYIRWDGSYGVYIVEKVALDGTGIWFITSTPDTARLQIDENGDLSFRDRNSGGVILLSDLLTWTDTTSTVATQYDLSQLEIHQLKGVDTAGISLGAILKWNGSRWVDSTDATGGTATGNADSLSGYDVVDGHVAGTDSIRFDNLNTDAFYFVLDANGSLVSINNDIGVMTLRDNTDTLSLSEIFTFADTSMFLVTNPLAGKIAYWSHADTLNYLILSGASITSGGNNPDTLVITASSGGSADSISHTYNDTTGRAGGERTAITFVRDSNEYQPTVIYELDTSGSSQTNVAAIAWNHDSTRYEVRPMYPFDTTGASASGSTKKLYLYLDTVRIGTDQGGSGTGGGVLDSIRASTTDGIWAEYINDSIVVVHVLAKSLGGVKLTGDSLEVDSTDFPATDYQVSLKADSSLTLYWADTSIAGTGLATQYDISLKADTSSALFWYDTLNTLATQYDVGKAITDSGISMPATVTDKVAYWLDKDTLDYLILGRNLSITAGGANRDTLKGVDTTGLSSRINAKPDSLADLLGVNTGGAVPGNILKFNGTNWVDSADEGTGAGDGQDADSIMGRRIDTTHRSDAELTTIVYAKDSVEYQFTKVFPTDTTGFGAATSSGKLYIQGDTIRYGTDLTGGANAGILDSVYGGPGASIVQNSDSAVTVNVNAKTGGGVIITTDSLEVDSTKFATNSFVTSNINDSLDANLLASPASVSQKVAFWPHQDTIDYIEIARNLSIVSGGANRDTLKGIDTTGLSSRINAKPDSLADLLGVNTAGVQAGNILKFNGTNWVDSADEGTGASDGQDADSILGKSIDSTGRMQAGKRTALVYDQDSGKHKFYWSPTIDTSGTEGASSKLYLDTDGEIKIGADLTGGANAGILDSVYGGPGASIVQNSDSAVTVNVNAKTGGGAIITNDSLEVDSSKYATQSDISDFMAHGDTSSLSSRIDGKKPNFLFLDSLDQAHTLTQSWTIPGGWSVYDPTEQTTFSITADENHAYEYMSSDTGYYAGLMFRTSGVDRWGVNKSSTNETGSNVGSDFVIRSFADNGFALATPLTITRSTSKATFSADVAVGTTLTADSIYTTKWGGLPASLLEWSDTTSILSTQYDISDLMAHGDTASLSARINSKIAWTDTVSTIASQFDLTAKLAWTDTVGTIATSYDLTLKSDASHNHTLDGLSNVLTTGKAAGNVIKWNGSSWVDSTDESGGEGSADGQDADSIMGQRVDTVGRMQAGLTTALVYDQDSAKYKHYYQPEIDTAGRAAAEKTAILWVNDSSKYKTEKLFSVDTTNASVSSSKRWLYYQNDTIKVSSSDGMFTAAFDDSLNNTHSITATEWAFENDVRINDTLQIGVDGGAKGVVNFSDGSANWEYLKVQDLTADRTIFLPNVNATDTLATLAEVRARGDSSTVLYWPDTSLAGGIATQADIAVKLTATEAQARLSADTTLIFAAHVGLGMATDTALFRPTYYYPARYHTGTDTLVITEIRAVGQGSPNLTLKMAYHATIYSGSATEINTSALTVTSTTTGQTATIANAKIAPGATGVYIWFTLPSVTTQPTALNVTAHGYRIKKR